MGRGVMATRANVRGEGWVSLLATGIWFVMASACTHGEEPVRHDAGLVDGAHADARATDGATESNRWSLDEVRSGYCALAAMALCEAQARCGCGPPCTVPAEIHSCVSRFEERAAAASGDVVFDGPRLEQLLAERIAHWSKCDYLVVSFVEAREDHTLSVAVDLGRRCRVGTGGTGCGPGSPCTAGEDFIVQCADGEGVCHEGTCMPMPDAGASCVGSSPVDMLPCAAPARCDGELCVVPAPVGTTCTSHGQCAPPARCLSGICRDLAEEGEPCNESGECVTGLICRDGTCTADLSTCRDGEEPCGIRGSCDSMTGGGACAPRSSEGEPCSRAFDDDDACEAGLLCDERAGECVVAPALGEPCLDTTCGEGAYCDAGLCAPSKALGEPCTPFVDGECIGYCDEASRTCVDRVGLSGACAAAFECEEELTCEGGECRPRPGEGEPCLEARCLPNLHCDPTTLTCVMPSIGARCRPTNGPACGDSLRCAATPTCGCTLR